MVALMYLGRTTVHILSPNWCEIEILCWIEIDDPILLGGNNGAYRVECDEMEKGRKQKGKFGHKSKVLANLWGARGIDSETGKKQWILEP